MIAVINETGSDSCSVLYSAPVIQSFMIESLSYPPIQFCLALGNSVISHSHNEYFKCGKFHFIYEKA